jgi:hypothetical protein
VIRTLMERSTVYRGRWYLISVGSLGIVAAVVATALQLTIRGSSSSGSRSAWLRLRLFDGSRTRPFWSPLTRRVVQARASLVGAR